jgi:hypothetical protein
LGAPRQMRIRLACAVALVGLPAVPVQASAAGLLGISTAPATAPVSLRSPAVQTKPPAALAPAAASVPVKAAAVTIKTLAAPVSSAAAALTITTPSTPVPLKPPPIPVPLKAPTVPLTPPPLPAPPKPPPLPPVPVKAPAPPIPLKPPSPPVLPAPKLPTTKLPTTKLPSVPVQPPPGPVVPKTPLVPGTRTGSAPPVKGAARAPATSPGPGATSRARSSAAAAAGQGSPGSGSSRSSASGPGSGYQTPALAPGALHGFAPLDPRERALIAAVRGLQGCLTSLPDHLRLVLQLRTGIGLAHPFSRAAVARYLRIKPIQVSRLEGKALRLLRGTARTHSCVGAAPSIATLLLTTGPGGPAAGSPTATGAVKAARYAKSAAQLSGLQVKPSSQGGESSLGLSPSPAAGNVLLALALVLSGMLLVGLLFAEELGLGSHYRRWRHRWVRRPPR